jgi:hypothetical protein
VQCAKQYRREFVNHDNSSEENQPHPKLFSNIRSKGSAAVPGKLLQAYCSSNILPTPQRDVVLPPLGLEGDFEAGDRARQSLCIRAVVNVFFITHDDSPDDIAHIPVEALLDFQVGFANVTRRRALFFTEDIAGEDFELGKGLAAVRPQCVHYLEHILFVAVEI